MAFTTNHLNGAYKLHKYIFGFYIMEPGLINGRSHYTSVHGDGAFALGTTVQSSVWFTIKPEANRKFTYKALWKYTSYIWNNFRFTSGLMLTLSSFGISSETVWIWHIFSLLWRFLVVTSQWGTRRMQRLGSFRVENWTMCTWYRLFLEVFHTSHRWVCGS